MTVEAVLTRIASVQAAITGVVRAYDGNRPPDSVEDLPAFVNLLAEFDDAIIEQSVSLERNIYPVTMLLLLTRQDLRDAAEAAVPFIERTRTAFRAQVTLGGLCTYARIERYRFGSLTYAGEGFIGVRFVLRVSAMEPVTFAAG